MLEQLLTRGLIMNFKPSIPVYIQIKDDIVNKIRNNVWEENQKLPSELKFMETYKVGRGTIRDAMKMVIDEGYAYIKKGVGTFVSQSTVGVSVEPFVSLTYFIKMRGLTLSSEVIEEKLFTVDSESSSRTGLKEGSKCLFVKRLRILEGKPLAVEEFYFSENAQQIFEGYDFTNPISHFLFEEKKIRVAKMNMDFNLLPVEKEYSLLLDIPSNNRMIASSRKVFIEPNNELFYYLDFYCGERSSYIGTDKFV